MYCYMADSQGGSTPRRILIVEDNPVVSSALALKLKAHGYETATAATAAEALQVARERVPDLLLLDLSLVTSDVLGCIGDGFSVLNWLRYRLPGLSFPVIIHTADHSPGVDAKARANGVSAVFRKGGDPRQLLEAIRSALGDEPTAGAEAA
jgi:CheY-like chemotaxis protein